MEFKPGAGARRRESKIDLVVWHYTAGEGDVKQLYAVLRGRKLGVEFFIDRVGVIWQFCDPIEVDTFDAGTANRRSVGVEMACYGYRPSAELVPVKGKDRRTYVDHVQSEEKRFAHFYPDQIAAAVSLAFALSDALSIPLKVPTDGVGDLYKSSLRSHERDEFSGHVGHYHVNSRKLDPGTSILNVLLHAFGKEV
jgi:hypothetical protein